jgi:hypothetical protein
MCGFATLLHHAAFITWPNGWANKCFNQRPIILITCQEYCNHLLLLPHSCSLQRFIFLLFYTWDDQKEMDLVKYHISLLTSCLLCHMTACHYHLSSDSLTFPHGFRCVNTDTDPFRLLGSPGQCCHRAKYKFTFNANVKSTAGNYPTALGDLTKFWVLPWATTKGIAVLRIYIRDPVLVLSPGSGIRNKFFRIRDPEWIIFYYEDLLLKP